MSKAVFASITALGFGLISNPPRRAIPAILLTAFLGYFTRATMIDFAGLHIFITCFTSALVMGCCGVAFGRLTRTPATVIYIPALLPMIPGMFAYKAIFAIMSYMTHIELADKAIYIDQFVTNFVYVIGILLSLAIGSIMPMFVFTKTANSLTRN
ncbi:MAG: threonine/serine exporter family protein [Paludibacteraceae bacterium]|nr:threonine/serine exporter family protein [Paludibacteraceae bacterium]